MWRLAFVSRGPSFLMLLFFAFASLLTSPPAGILVVRRTPVGVGWVADSAVLCSCVPPLRILLLHVGALSRPCAVFVLTTLWPCVRAREWVSIHMRHFPLHVDPP